MFTGAEGRSSLKKCRARLCSRPQDFCSPSRHVASARRPDFELYRLYQGISLFGRHGADGSAHKRARPGRCATARSDIREQSPCIVHPLKLRMKRRGPERRRLQVQRRRWEHPKPARAQHSRCRIQQVHRRHRRHHHLSPRCRRSKRFFRREHHLHLYMGSSSLDALRLTSGFNCKRGSPCSWMPLRTRKRHGWRP